MWAWYSRRAAWTSWARSWVEALLLLLSVLLELPVSLLLTLVPFVLSS